MHAIHWQSGKIVDLAGFTLSAAGTGAAAGPVGLIAAGTTITGRINDTSWRLSLAQLPTVVIAPVLGWCSLRAAFAKLAGAHPSAPCNMEDVLAVIANEPVGELPLAGGASSNNVAMPRCIPSTPFPLFGGAPEGTTSSTGHNIARAMYLLGLFAFFDLSAVPCEFRDTAPLDPSNAAQNRAQARLLGLLMSMNIKSCVVSTFKNWPRLEFALRSAAASAPRDIRAMAGFAGPAAGREGVISIPLRVTSADAPGYSRVLILLHWSHLFGVVTYVVGPHPLCWGDERPAQKRAVARNFSAAFALLGFPLSEQQEVAMLEPEALGRPLWGGRAGGAPAGSVPAASVAAAAAAEAAAAGSDDDDDEIILCRAGALERALGGSPQVTGLWYRKKKKGERTGKSEEVEELVEAVRDRLGVKPISQGLVQHAQAALAARAAT